MDERVVDLICSCELQALAAGGADGGELLHCLQEKM
jgi:hypothetical protein